MLGRRLWAGHAGQNVSNGLDVFPRNPAPRPRLLMVLQFPVCRPMGAPYLLLTGVINVAVMIRTPDG